jgi:K+-sensing histidine kinase KdpD
LRLASAPWPEPVRTAVVLPIRAAAHENPAGLLVAGVSPRRPLDVGDRTFLDLAAGHIGTALADARACEEERKRAEALAELDRAKTALLSNVSHEFRTPLTLLLGPLEEEIGEHPARRERLDVSTAAACGS